MVPLAWRIAYFACLVALLLWAPPASALDVPPLTGRVVDVGAVLAPEDEARISERLAAYERATGHQFAVLTVPTLDGDPVEDFSIRVVEAWKLGKKGEDDGLLLLLVVRDRKLRVEVGYGLEGSITDAVSARVIREAIAPRLRGGDYAGGIEAGLSELMRAAGGAEGLVPPARDDAGRSGRGDAGGSRLHLLFFLLFFVLPVLLPMLLGRGRRRGGVFFGGPFIGAGFGGRSGGGFGGGGFGGGGGGFGGGGASGDW